MIDVVIKIKAGDYETKIPYEYEIVPIDEDTMTVREAREHTDRQKEMKKNQRQVWHDKQTPHHNLNAGPVCQRRCLHGTERHEAQDMRQQ